MLNFKHDQIKYTTAALTNDFSILQHVGEFGYANLPENFGDIPEITQEAHAREPRHVCG